LSISNIKNAICFVLFVLFCFVMLKSPKSHTSSPPPHFCTLSFMEKHLMNIHALTWFHNV
jgi:hypothetical protein